MSEWAFPTKEVIERAGKHFADEPITEATQGWCDVDCNSVRKTFLLCMFLLMVLGSTGRIGNVLVALR